MGRMVWQNDVNMMLVDTRGENIGPGSLTSAYFRGTEKKIDICP